MDGLQARLQSFKKSKRVKNPKKSSNTTLKWPHPQDFIANPATLAEAGFYFDPSYDDPDNVTCFNCDKQLAGWEEDDDPYLIHWNKCAQTCCWAVVQCGLRADMDRSGRFVFPDKTRLPIHKSMEKARLETFTLGKGWVHDKTKNHSANSKSMARAGFAYTPHETGDDLASCLYCDVSLGGWDEDDDPMEEHRKRAAKSDTNCPFFELTETRQTRSKSKPPSAVGAKRRATSHKRTASRSKPKSPEEETVTDTEQEAPSPPPRPHSGRSDAPQNILQTSDEAQFNAPSTYADPPPTTEPPPTRSKSKPPSAKRRATSHKRTASKSKPKSPEEETVTDTEQELHTAPSTPPRPILHKEEPKHSSRSDAPQTILQTSDDTSVEAQPSGPSTNTTLPTTEPPPTRSKSKANSVLGAKRRTTSHKRTTSRSKPRSTEMESKQPTKEEEKWKPGKTPKAKVATEGKPKQPSKVVEVSSDEEEVEKRDNQKLYETKTRIIEPVESSGPSSLPAVNSLKDSEQPSLEIRDTIDVSMHDTEPVIQETVADTEQEPLMAPSTPPRPIFHEQGPSNSGRSDAPHSILQTSDDTSIEAQPGAPSTNMTLPPTTEPPYLPPLSRLPFMPLQILSEAELDMTVEEWIRYQIEVEQDRFKRDGERELERFKKRAEEVRKSIDGL